MRNSNSCSIHLYRGDGGAIACRRWGDRGDRRAGVSLCRQRNREGRNGHGVFRIASDSPKQRLDQQHELRSVGEVVKRARGSLQGPELYRILDHDHGVGMHWFGLEADGIVEQQHRIELSLLRWIADSFLQLVFLCRFQHFDLRVGDNAWMDEQSHVLCPLRLTTTGHPPRHWSFGESESCDTVLMSDSSGDRRLGDPVVFDAFYRDHAEGILRYFYRHTDDPDIAADLCAETFAAALANSHQFDASEGTPTRWLHGIARRQLAMYWRRRKVADRYRRKLGVPTEPIDEESAQALRRTEDILDAAAALAALEQLPPKLRETVRLRVINQLEYPEIARRLNCNPGTARVRVSRGLYLLHEMLK